MHYITQQTLLYPINCFVNLFSLQLKQNNLRGNTNFAKKKKKKLLIYSNQNIESYYIKPTIFIFFLTSLSSHNLFNF